MGVSQLFNIKLKPCPFCGSKGDPMAVRLDWQPTLPYKVFCSTCCSQTGTYHNEEDAIKAWNRRADGTE